MKQVIFYIAFIIILEVLVVRLEEAPKERAEKRYDEIYRITQEMRKEIIDLAEENDNFIRDYKEVIELEGEEDYHKYVIDDYHTSTAFEEVLGEFENDIEDIGW